MSRRPASRSFPLGFLPNLDARQDVFHAFARSCQDNRVVRQGELEIPGQKHGLDFKNRLRNLRLGINLSGGLRVKTAGPEDGCPFRLSLAIFVYAVGFVGGFLSPTRLDGPRQGSLTAALAINVGLLALFAVQHSGMARPAFRR
jgi:hypothetical protein